MTLYVCLLLLVFVLILTFARLCSLCWSHHGPAQSAAAARHTPLQRLLKPRPPRDCPACRLASTFSSVVGPAPPPVRPWREVKSRRGAPKRVVWTTHIVTRCVPAHRSLSKHSRKTVHS